MYNLDERVEGIDVVDFPGVDDRDESIPDLADLLLTVSQIVIFVVDFRNSFPFHKGTVGEHSLETWLHVLQQNLFIITTAYLNEQCMPTTELGIRPVT